MSDESKVVFDAGRPIEVKLLSGGAAAKKVRLRFPSDAEWAERQRRRKPVIRRLGRGKSVTQTPDTSDVDLALFRRILEAGQDGGGGVSEIDGYEAGRIIEELERAEVDDVQPEAGGFRILLRVPGGVTEHLVRKPTAREMFEHGRAFAAFTDLPRGRQELSINLEAAGELYAKLCRKTEGYAGAPPIGTVPIIHQAVVVGAAIEETRASLEEDGADFFGPAVPPPAMPGPSSPASAS